PRIPTEDLITIAKDLKFSSEGLISLYSNIYLKRLCGKTEPCLFLDNRRLCMIYGHPLRPDVCRLYPFSFGGTDADCDAYLEHKRVVEILLADEKSFEIYDASFCPNRNVRLISDSKWPQIHSKLKRLNVTGDMIRAFMILNGASKF
ncbi:MAG TPA: YkgJ family cysteine cluster protein, partial [Syntrophales bacterium]|nr:YkgJ family cysteine cluster protein [Syntrophales bacterium]